MTLLYVCAMLIFFEVALVYDASFVRYSVLSSCDIYGGGKVRVSEFMIFLALQLGESK